MNRLLTPQAALAAGLILFFLLLTFSHGTRLVHSWFSGLGFVAALLCVLTGVVLYVRTRHG